MMSDWIADFEMADFEICELFVLKKSEISNTQMSDVGCDDG